jgi:hypothetical protein
MLTIKSLEQIKIATPCEANWDEMMGDERSRHCLSCKKNVYDISELKAEDAVALINDKEGDICIQYYQRHDGTVISQDCSVGLKAKAQRFRVKVLALLLLCFSFGVGKLSAKTSKVKKTPKKEAPKDIVDAATKKKIAALKKKIAELEKKLKDPKTKKKECKNISKKLEKCRRELRKLEPKRLRGYVIRSR